MLPEDVYELVNAGDPRISPDGSRVAFVVTAIDRESNEYRGAIWVAPLDGSAEPRPFTSGERRDTSPRWSPDGNWLAFVSNRGGDEKTPMNLYVIPAEGGEARRLTDQKESVDEIAWSPDSKRIAFALARPRRGVRGRGRQEARAAAVHARLPQARQRRLHRRPPEAHLRRRHRGRRAAAADERRLRARQPRRGRPTASTSCSTACATSAGTSSSSTACTASTSTAVPSRWR